MSHHVEKNTLKNIADACRVFISVIRPLIRSSADVMSAREAMSKFEPACSMSHQRFTFLQECSILKTNLNQHGITLKVARRLLLTAQIWTNVWKTEKLFFYDY